MRSHLLCLLTVVATLMTAAHEASAVIAVSAGANSAAEDFGVRFRSFQPTGADEVYLGVPDLGVAGNRVAQQFDWGSGPTSFSFTFDYVKSTGLISTTVGGGSALNYSFTPTLLVTGLNVTLADRDTDGELWLTNLVVNGEAVPDFTDSTDEGFLDFSLTNLPAAADLSIAGTINRTGSFTSSQERSRIEIRAATQPIPEPSLVGVGCVAVGVGLVRTRRRR